MANQCVAIILMANGVELDRRNIVVPDDQIEDLQNKFQTSNDWFDKYDIDN